MRDVKKAAEMFTKAMGPEGDEKMFEAALRMGGVYEIWLKQRAANGLPLTKSEERELQALRRAK